MTELCNVEKVILQAMKNFNHWEPSAEQIATEVEKIRMKGMSLPLIYSALHGMEKNGLVANRSDVSGKLFFRLTDKGKEQTKGENSGTKIL